MGEGYQLRLRRAECATGGMGTDNAEARKILSDPVEFSDVEPEDVVFSSRN